VRRQLFDLGQMKAGGANRLLFSLITQVSLNVVFYKVFTISQLFSTSFVHNAPKVSDG
jgi:hypothetical protein